MSEPTLHTVGRGQNNFYIYRNGCHFLKTVFNDVEAEKQALTAAKILNEYPAMCAVVDIAAYALIHTDAPIKGGASLKKALSNLEAIRAKESK